MKDIMKGYLDRFEIQIVKYILEGGETRNIYQPGRLVPIQGGKLMDTDFGRFIGHTFDNEGTLAFNYYGLYKVSTGIIAAQEKSKAAFPGIKTIVSPVINFASILPSDMSIIDPELSDGFPRFKEYIVQLRWQ